MTATPTPPKAAERHAQVSALEVQLTRIVEQMNLRKWTVERAIEFYVGIAANGHAPDTKIEVALKTIFDFVSEPAREALRAEAAKDAATSTVQESL